MKPTILIVDDEQTNITLIKSLFNEEYDVRTATDGREGLEKAKALLPDLLILDVMMPKMDGFKVCALLKSDSRYKQIPIIILSSRAGDDDVELAQQAGADVYMLKPINKEKLAIEIDKVLKAG